MEDVDKVLILDFGAQYAHLIARRIRECRVYSELIPYNTKAEDISKIKPKALILSGGPASVYDKAAPLPDQAIYDLGIPILGICYGLQIIVHQLGGEVVRANKREYGKATLNITDTSDIFKGFKPKAVCWMSHGDRATKLPIGFKSIAHTDNSPYAAIRDKARKIYALQFHPEVSHTPRGKKILRNFLFEVCKCKASWEMPSFIERSIEEIRAKVGSERVLCALSGGIDSSTTAALIHKAVGDQLTCIFVDHGLLRKGEADEVIRTFRDTLGIRLITINASKRFLDRLKGVVDPEEKRKIIGEEFLNVFTEASIKYGPFKWLAQGTLYPDVIESAANQSPASKIKTHHNVGGLPEQIEFKLLEPLRDLYKDEVRRLATLLGLPDRIVKRHPFPGPGLAVRVIGEVTEEKLQVCREASSIVEEELQKHNLYDKVWQAFAVVGDDKAVGVLGDARSYGYIVSVRIVQSSDAMTADWVKLPYKVLERISSRITNEIPGVTWVTYVISSKPPATIEPQ
ncbi:MAG: glutamine-hydrolyzing GMP synthase [Nitrososphaerales archaeon]